MQKVKSTFKYVFVAIMLCVMLFLCCSCAEIQNMTVINDDGTIDEMVYVAVDKEELEAQQCNYQDVKVKIQQKAVQSAENIRTNFEFNLDVAITLTQDVETKQFLTSLKGGITICGNAWQEEMYSIGLHFKNPDVYRYFYGITSTEREVDEVEKHFLYTKVSFYGLSKFADYRFTTLYNTLATDFNTEFEGKFVDVQDTKLYFTYTTTERREHSDADVIFKANGKYYHTWEIVKNADASHGEEFYQILTVYYNIANTGNCILCCLMFSLLLCVILLLVCLIIKKSKNI
ncbi:MAG: hypothetical protein MJ149_02805, partial [Clostridia bacterium]|nr:hypothetical protein [Clostridia bacterium]